MSESKKKPWKVIIITAFVIVGGLCLSIVAVPMVLIAAKQTNGGELRLIPAESMRPALEAGDRVFVKSMGGEEALNRGEIVVFYPPTTKLEQDPVSVLLRKSGLTNFVYPKEANRDVAYIKRVIGLPGDTVQVKPGLGVFVNGKELPEPYVNTVANSCTIVFDVPEQGLDATCGPVKVPPGKYFLLGDNRNLSLDSRYWGFADRARVIGKAASIVWPAGRAGELPVPDYAGVEK